MKMPGGYDEFYVVAREVLLDALDALEEHRPTHALGHKNEPGGGGVGR